MNRRRRLQEALAQGPIVVAPGAHDALTARIIEKTGFQAVYMTGYGQSASHLGRPDVGLMTLSEMAERARNMADAVQIPVIADADTGFGNAVNVIRTIRLYEQAGVAAIQLEDQVAPKKCGHMMGRQVVAVEEMVGKIKAAADARLSRDFLLIARTDARTVYGLEEALERAKAYEEAGADILFIESPESTEEMRKITSLFKIPLLANMVEGGRTPLLSNGELEALGYGLVIYPASSTYIMAKAVMRLMEELIKEGTTRGLMDEMVTFHQFNELVGLPEIRRLEEDYVR